MISNYSSNNEGSVSSFSLRLTDAVESSPQSSVTLSNTTPSKSRRKKKRRRERNNKKDSESPSLSDEFESSQLSSVIDLKKSKERRGKNKTKDPATDVDTLRALVADLQLCHYSSDRASEKCRCLLELKESGKSDNDLISIFQSCREFMSLLNRSGPSGRTEHLRSYLQGMREYD